jgi:hypothetical protein
MSFWTAMVLSDGIVGMSVPALSKNESLHFGGIALLGLPNNLGEMIDLQEKQKRKYVRKVQKPQVFSEYSSFVLSV